MTKNMLCENVRPNMYISVTSFILTYLVTGTLYNSAED